MTRIAAGIIWLSAGVVTAAEPASGNRQGAETGRPADNSWVALTLDNDVISHQDRHYTSGIQVSFPVSRDNLPDALRNSTLINQSAGSDIVAAFGQRIYTPFNITREIPDPSDRPYAGWLYLLTDLKIQGSDSVDHWVASVGVVGPLSIAHSTQHLIHRVLNQPMPKGWNAQLKNEAALLLGYERSWPAMWRGSAGEHQWDVSPRVGATVGNVFTYASTGVVARLGHNLPADLVGTRLSLAPFADSYRGGAGITSWYVWLGIEGRAIARNIFLDGNSGRDSARVPRENFGHDMLLGIAATWQSWTGNATFVRRSKEFSGQANVDVFGQLTISFAY
ncbi:MAG: lipid A deacylase LpxR family protein [Betaproteobacteria bacterium]